MILYHGTNVDFDEIEIKKKGITKISDKVFTLLT